MQTARNKQIETAHLPYGSAGTDILSDESLAYPSTHTESQNVQPEPDFPPGKREQRMPYDGALPAVGKSEPGLLRLQSERWNNGMVE
jgi:hypothetical protein